MLDVTKAFKLEILQGSMMDDHFVIISKIECDDFVIENRKLLLQVTHFLLVLQILDVDTHGMNVDKMREVLVNFPDFKYEKSKIERLLIDTYSHIVYMLPKYHCELNPIE